MSTIRKGFRILLSYGFADVEYIHHDNGDVEVTVTGCRSGQTLHMHQLPFEVDRQAVQREVLMNVKREVMRAQEKEMSLRVKR